MVAGNEQGDLPVQFLDVGNTLEVCIRRITVNEDFVKNL